jgi:transcriptional regulator with XRE-family HTH domain
MKSKALPGKERLHEHTPLYDWLRKNSIPQRTFARETGLGQQTVMRLCLGRITPTLVAAFVIEQATDGEIPAVSWLGTEVTKYEWNLVQRRKGSDTL